MVTIRQAGADDHPAVLGCIRDVYNDSYCRREIYSEEIYRRKVSCGDWVLFIIDNDKKGPMGTIGFLRPPLHERIYEFGLYAVKNKHQRRGVGTLLFDYAAALLKETGCPVAYTNLTTLHTSAQKLVETRTDFICTGFLHAAIHEGADNPLKESLTVHTLALLGHNQNPRLYLPTQMEPTAHAVYQSLGAVCHVQTEKEPLPNGAVLRHYFDEYACTLHICVEQCGANLVGALSLLESKYCDGPYFSVLLYLNIAHPSAVAGYETLAELQYSFAGFLPFYFESEYLILCKLYGAPLSLGAMKLTPKTREVFFTIQGGRDGNEA